MYAIVDIETTGTSPRYGKITEIAVLIHDGEKIIDRFTTLINPEKYIPAHITALTGITNEMVADAPKFYEIAKKLVEITDNKVFVAHNVSFDYGFIKSEFKSLGFTFIRDQLCTVRLSRKLIPGLRSYSLGNICQELSINNNGRHRAFGDVLATAELFDLLLNLNRSSGLNLFDNKSLIFKNLNPSLDPAVLGNLPEETGLYYFYDDHGSIIYIGKSKNIRSRVYSHLSSNSTRKAIDMKQKIVDISYELTGSELIALLKESSEIKKHKPLYNRMQRRSLFQYGLFHSADENGYINFCIEKNSEKNEAPLMSFSSKKEAVEFLYHRIEKYELCQKLCGLYPTNGNCFHYELTKCNGACIGEEKPDLYNQRAEQFISSLSYNPPNTILFDKGRHLNEYSVIKIKNGRYLGFGYLDADEAITSPDMIDEYITRYSDNREVHYIIKNYLKKHRVLRRIDY